jgi:glutathione S-transferase
MLSLYYHPLSSFAWKVLIALYEKEVPFEPRIVDFADPHSAAEFRSIWPMAKMPVLVDHARNCTIPETSIIIEYLEMHYPGVELIPEDRDAALQVRLSDRFYDLYVQQPMQKIVTDRIRPEGTGDSHGVEQARASLRTAYDFLERDMESRDWAAGYRFGMADCAAAPGLFYANKVEPFEMSHPNLDAYYRRLLIRPSFARVLVEAEPYFSMFPG